MPTGIVPATVRAPRVAASVTADAASVTADATRVTADATRVTGVATRVMGVAASVTTIAFRSRSSAAIDARFIAADAPGGAITIIDTAILPAATGKPKGEEFAAASRLTCTSRTAVVGTATVAATTAARRCHHSAPAAARLVEAMKITAATAAVTAAATAACIIRAATIAACIIRPATTAARIISPAAITAACIVRPAAAAAPTFAAATTAAAGAAASRESATSQRWRQVGGERATRLQALRILANSRWSADAADAHEGWPTGAIGCSACRLLALSAFLCKVAGNPGVRVRARIAGARRLPLWHLIQEAVRRAIHGYYRRRCHWGASPNF